MTSDSEPVRFDGRVEGIEDGLVIGWAWNPSSADAPAVGVEVMVDGVVVGGGGAYEFAPGLAEVGVGDGNHGFAIQIPESLADGARHFVTVLGGRHDDEIPVVPDRKCRSTGPWEGTEFVFVGRDENVVRLPFTTRQETAGVAAEDPSVAALQGREGWLFGISERERRHGMGEPADEIVAQWVSVLERGARGLAVLGVRHVAAVVPAKLGVYAEYAPDDLTAASDRRAGRALTALARDVDHLTLVDLHESLVDAKRHGHVYPPAEPGWNARGAFFAHRFLLKVAGVRGLDPLSLDGAPLVPSTRPEPRSLAGLPPVAWVEGAFRATTETSPPAPAGAEVDADLHSLRIQRMPAEPHLEISGGPTPQLFVRTPAGDRPRVLLIGHHCLYPLVPWLAEAASRLAVISAPVVGLETLELEYPDLVLQVLDERLLGDPPPGMPDPASGETDSTS